MPLDLRRLDDIPAAAVISDIQTGGVVRRSADGPAGSFLIELTGTTLARRANSLAVPDAGFVSVMAAPDDPGGKLADSLHGRAEAFADLVARVAGLPPMNGWELRATPPGQLVRADRHASLDDAINLVNTFDYTRNISRQSQVSLPPEYLARIQALDAVFRDPPANIARADRQTMVETLSEASRQWMIALLTPHVEDLLRAGPPADLDEKRAVAREVNRMLREHNLAIEDPQSPGAACSVIVNSSPSKSDGWFVLQRRQGGEAGPGRNVRPRQGRVSVGSVDGPLRLIFAPREERFSHDARQARDEDAPPLGR